MDKTKRRKNEIFNINMQNLNFEVKFSNKKARLQFKIGLK